MKNTNKNMLYTFCAFRSSCSVHSSVSAADYNYIFANIQLTIICLEITKKLQSVNGLTFFQFQSARLASSTRTTLPAASPIVVRRVSGSTSFSSTTSALPPLADQWA